MAEEKRQNLSNSDHGSDDKQIENLEVENAEASSDNTIEMNHNSSGNAHYMMQQNAIEVDPVDVITVEELSHASLDENFSENSQCKVSEFVSDEENEADKHLAEVYVDNMGRVVFQTNSQEYDENSPIFSFTKKQKGELIEIVETESLNKKDKNITCTTENWGEAERKRKKNLTPLIQNKRSKEIQISDTEDIIKVLNQDSSSDEFTEASSSSDNSGSKTENEFMIQCPCTEDDIQIIIRDSSNSGEFADAESSSSSDTSDSNYTNETAKQMPSNDLSSGIQQVKERKIESLSKMKSSKVKISNPNSSQNYHFQNKTGENIIFPSFLKGEALPAFTLTDEAKKKFELSMPTIFEVRESDSDEKISQPLQSKTNPLKMKSKVGKRKDKCNVCNVRLGLCAIECRCGGYYCAKHRYDKEHNCSFDYKSMGAAEIRKNNPRIVAEKVRKL